MLKRLELSGIHTSIDKSLNKYVYKKIGTLDKYIPRRYQNSVHVEVYLKENKIKGKDRFQCEVSVQLPHKSLIVKENAQTLFAAVDIVEAKLKLQLKKYKELTLGGRNRRHLIGRFLKENPRI